MKATRLLRDRVVFDDGALAEMVIWQVPTPVLPSHHGLKYRFVYIVNGERIVGYDNERGKGDHRHFKGNEAPYQFVSIERLLADFMTDIRKLRGQV